MASDDRSPWPTITLLGVLCGLALGALVVILVRGQRRQLGDGGGTPELGPVDLGFFPLPPIPSPRGRELGATKTEVRRMRSRPVARTLTVSDSSPTLVLQAVGSRNWKVWVRTIGPPGSFATFSISNNAGDAILVPAGSNQPMQIPSGEFLYAQGDMPDVCVSVSGGEG